MAVQLFLPSVPQISTYSLREYVVTLNANGGFVDPEDLRFTIETLAQQTLPTPSMANATFLGWFEGGQKIEAIDDNEAVDQVFIDQTFVQATFFLEMVTKFKTAMTIM